MLDVGLRGHNHTFYEYGTSEWRVFLGAHSTIIGSEYLRISYRGAI